ncbi:hypothetical protein EVAR_28052_1 [Eumeta japonica]|uniref:Uncharacterized protein n=1 Tax=Eumeta variegata TaxID=151549 RepID=A0A4C1W629_EUMVA|nr:hypothetical protein EVAR_28052_1 [Eumeta japonica]
MCSNQLIESVECYMDEIFDTFEEFLKKSLVVVSISIGTIVLLLIYVTNVGSGRGANMPPCCQQPATAPTSGGKTMPGSGGATATTGGSPCPPRPCPPAEDCPEASKENIIECDGKCPNKSAEKKGGLFSKVTCKNSDRCPSVGALQEKD